MVRAGRIQKIDALALLHGIHDRLIGHTAKIPIPGSHHDIGGIHQREVEGAVADFERQAPIAARHDIIREIVILNVPLYLFGKPSGAIVHPKWARISGS
jgi:hypothetical protein